MVDLISEGELNRDAARVDEALGLLRRTHPFSALAEAPLRALASTVGERAIIPGDLVVREGDAGEEFYLVTKGALHVIARAFDGTPLVVARLEPGQCFGEQSLLDDTDRVRKASVRAVTAGRLLTFPREALLRAKQSDASLSAHLGSIGDAQRELRGTSFREGILHDLGIGSSYTVTRFAAGEMVIREGDVGEKAYLILTGRARATRQENGVKVALSEMIAGQFFGERAILTDQPRAASVEAVTDLELACLDGAWFRETIASNPRLRSIMASLQAMYLLPSRGLLTLQSGHLGTQPTLTATHDLGDGRQVVSTRLTELGSFVARRVDAPEATAVVQFEDLARGISRAVHIYDGQLVEIEAEGPWPDLGHMYEMLLDSAPVGGADLAAFEAGGDFSPAPPPLREAAEVVCRCSGVTASKVTTAVADGCVTVEAIAARTAATLVCGGCLPTIREFLGLGAWLPVACDTIRHLTEDLRAFRLRLVQPGGMTALPGQHIVLQARIRGCWVARPYTIAALPDEAGVFEIVVKREPQGLLSRWMFDQMSICPALRISQPAGNFHIDVKHAFDVVFLAGGVGITPGLAMARALEAAPHRGKLLLHHSASDAESAIYRDELERLAAEIDGFAYEARVTGSHGRLGHDQLATLVGRHPVAAFLLCGSQGYVDDIEAMLLALGVPSSRVQVERFTPIG